MTRLAAVTRATEDDVRPRSADAVAPLLWCSPWRARGLAVATGLLYFVAFPGIDVWPLSFVTWVPLLLAMRGRSVKTATGLAWISGFTMTFVGFYWMLGMLQAFSGFPAWICVGIMVLLAAYQGGRIGLFGFLAARMTALGWPRGPSFGLAFVVSEFVYPLLFPWYFGATVHQIPALTQLAELGTPIPVGLVLFMVNHAVAELVAARLEKRVLPWKLFGASLGVVAACAVYGVVRLAMVDAAVAAAPKGRVGLVQANLGLMAKRVDREEGLRRHVDGSQALLSRAPHDLIVWSETSVAGAVYEDDAAEFYPRAFTREIDAPVLFGALLMRDVSDARGRTLFNTVLMSDRAGNIVGRYDKRKLLAFGEYLPLGDTFPVLYEWSANTGKFTPGDSLDALPLGDRKVSAHICYEDVLPGFVNSMMRTDDAELLVNLTNDAWYGDTTQPWIHLALAKFRAIEQRRFFVRSTNSGVSAIIDAGGRVLAHTSTFERATLSQEVAYLDGSTPYRIYGGMPFWICSVLSVALCWRRRRSMGIS